MANNIRAVAVILIIAYFILLDFPPVNSTTRVPLGKKPCAVGDADRIIGSSSDCGSNLKKLAFDSKGALPSPPPPPQSNGS
ncbi:hypothetical protein OROMI_010238 [Orobanche minor]